MVAKRKQPARRGDGAAAAAVQATKDQQRLLDLFAAAFAAVLARHDLAALLRHVKQALYDRDFAAAFADEQRLEAYAARWSPTRALCYAAVFLAVAHHLADVSAPCRAPEHRAPEHPGPAAPEPARRLNVLAVGGCAAEHVALASYLRDTSSCAALTLLDSAPWSHVVHRLHDTLCAPPPLHKYASAAARAAAPGPFLGTHQLDLTFSRVDVLSLSRDALAALVGSQPLVVTLMFTLNELYTAAGIGKTTAFLASLGHVLPDRSLLLVVDSPGSYAETPVGKDKKPYPMRWLLHHTLVGTETQGRAWELLESHDSVWFRLPDGLHYPIPLENMRYQLHLYRIRKTRP